MHNAQYMNLCREVFIWELPTSTDFFYGVIYNDYHKEKAMIQNIYVDVYFAYNFLMDFAVLFITGIVFKNKKSIFRITISAGMASLYSVFLLVLNAGGVVAKIFTYIIIPILMVFLAFGKSDIKNQIRKVLTLYFVTFVLSGIVNAFYYSKGFETNIIEMATSGTFGNISISFILCIVVVAGTFTTQMIYAIGKRIKNGRQLFYVTLTVQKKKIHVTALCDTGNSLIDPMTKKPVSVIEKSCLKPLKDKKLKYLVVPYNSIGKKHGLMEAFIADCMDVDGVAINNAIIGIHDGKLEQNKMYQMILHPDMLKEKEN